MDTLTILQHNVLNWKERKFGLSAIYAKYNPDIVLFNSNGLKDTDSLKLWGYSVHKRNQSGNPSDGTAISIKHGLVFKLYDDFISDALAIEVSTTTGRVMIATLYQLPARPYIPTPDFYRIFRRKIPVYFIGDLNANHPRLGYR